ncbi:MAG: hypothetical protein ACU84Q_01500 [Gammaproteobacteria bacterium]
MNWEAIGAISEVVGAIGVIVSILYLATQIRHGARAAEDAAFRDAFVAVSDTLANMGEGENAEIILKGLRNFSDLNSREKYTFDSIMTGFFTLVESTIISNEVDLMSDETMENWSFVLRTRYLGYPGMQEWWGGAKKIYIQHAQDWMDRQIERSDAKLDYWGIM